MVILYSDLADDVLCQYLIAGDERAFVAIYDRYWKRLFTIANNRIGSLVDAEEIVQDIFTTLWNNRIKLEIRTGLSNYLSVSVKYRVIKMLDKQYAQKKYLDSVLARDLIDDSTQELLAFEELRAELEKYVGDLPEKCQLIFRLSREQGYSQREIAQQLQISEKTVEAHLGKAFKRLRTRLAGFMFTLL